MTQKQLNEISQHLHAVPVDSLQRASLLYAARRLRASGEAGMSSAVLLLEAMADEHYDAITITGATDETIVADVS